MSGLHFTNITVEDVDKMSEDEVKWLLKNLIKQYKASLIAQPNNIVPNELW